MIDERLEQLRIQLPPPPAAIASYLPVRRSGDLAFVSGQIPTIDGQPLHPGALGREVSVEQGSEAARRCTLQALAALRASLGSLDGVEGIVQVSVFVASAPGFTQQSAVANGASDLLVEVFGESGAHARVSVGVAALPMGASVEVALVAQVREA